METKRYPVSVFWSDEDEGYIAVASDLDGCSAFGATAEEALSELQIAMLAWIEAAKAAGNPVPPPSSPAAEQEYSGRTLVRMPKWLHRQLATSAERNGVSLNQHIVTLLTWNEAFAVSREGPRPRVAASGPVFDVVGVATTQGNSYVIYGHSQQAEEYEKIVIASGPFVTQSKSTSGVSYIGGGQLENITHRGAVPDKDLELVRECMLSTKQ